MIPKKIHYCWFGGKDKSKLIKKCIKSWKKYCKGYEIIEWNESNFDININKYVSEAYKSKKYAFVSDYARLFILYNYGGIYMDTDMEVVKNLDDLLLNYAFLGSENDSRISAGIIGVEKENKWIKDVMDSYENQSFIDENGKCNLRTIVKRITDISIKKYGYVNTPQKVILKDNIVIYDSQYFYPKTMKTGKINITPNTYTIHYFMGSWLNLGDRVKGKIIIILNNMLGEKLAYRIINLKRSIFRSKKQN